MSPPTDNDLLPADDIAPSYASRLAEVAVLFTRLGFTAFGGPAAHVAMMQDEVVVRRRWLDRRQFMDAYAAINFIPGPNSTELAIHLGYVRAGFAGLVVAGVCFIVPAVLIILPIAWSYVWYGQRASAQSMMAGINAAVVAIVVAACWRFAKGAITTRFTGLVAVGALALAYVLQPFPLMQPDLVVLAMAAFAGVVRHTKLREAGTPSPTEMTRTSINSCARFSRLQTVVILLAVAGLTLLAWHLAHPTPIARGNARLATTRRRLCHHRRDSLWQRICPYQLFATRHRRFPRLAHARSTAQRRLGWPIHAGTVAHDRHIHRVSARVANFPHDPRRDRRCPYRDGGHLRAVVCVDCAGGPIPVAAPRKSVGRGRRSMPSTPPSWR